MSDILLSILFGIIEGLTEFLPVSSTAHLRIAQRLTLGEETFKTSFWMMYAIVIQLGAILAVVVYFAGRLRAFVRSFPRGESGERTLLNHPVTLVAIAFLATIGPVLIFKKAIKANLNSMYAIGAALLIGGVIMWAVDVLFDKARTTAVERMNPLQALWVGLIQSLSAIFPGLSRSMATIAAGQSAGLSRSAALEFSFFLSIPTMFAATSKEMKDFFDDMGASGAGLSMSAHQWLVLAIGFAVSFLVAWAVIAWFLAWVRKHGFTPFAVYRIGLGLAVLAAVRWG
jgi:undecaprenyl-diphosphatase